MIQAKEKPIASPPPRPRLAKPWDLCQRFRQYRSSLRRTHTHTPSVRAAPGASSNTPDTDQTLAIGLAILSERIVRAERAARDKAPAPRSPFYSLEAQAELVEDFDFLDLLDDMLESGGSGNALSRGAAATGNIIDVLDDFFRPTASSYHYPRQGSPALAPPDAVPRSQPKPSLGGQGPSPAFAACTAGAAMVEGERALMRRRATPTSAYLRERLERARAEVLRSCSHGADTRASSLQRGRVRPAHYLVSVR